MEKKYFFDSLHNDIYDHREYYERKLIQDKDSISLSDLSRYIYQTYTNQELETIHNRSIEEYDNILFDFVLKLLKNNELKVAQYDVLHLDPQGNAEFLEFTGTPEETIQLIKEGWYEARKRAQETKTPIDHHYEYAGVIFTLPETEWFNDKYLREQSGL